MTPLPFEVWASPEATVARIDAHSVRDQVRETGHAAREGDIGLIADLGVRAARYPVLWEHAAPENPARVDLSWAQRRLRLLQDRGIEPVVTLLHHGSGPRYTSLTDPDFPELFAQYATAVARAFPWVRRWTPINEPTTTARFSTLYGHWYPNGNMDHAAFGAAIVNEALATVLAMKAIRRFAPNATLIATEDLQGFLAADPAAERYCAHKRERAVLFAELLLGRVRRGHPLWRYLREDCGVPVRALQRLSGEPTAPGLMGYNYYANSERFVWSAGDGRFGNVPLIDVAGPPIDPKPLLRVAHARLGLPVGFTEVHICGDEHERVAWLRERADDALTLVREGVPFTVFAPWAAFGMVDWRSVLCRRDGCSEDGIYSFARAGETPQPTAVSAAVASLARGVLPPVSIAAPWWRDDSRRVSFERLIAQSEDTAA